MLVDEIKWRRRMLDIPTKTKVQIKTDDEIKWLLENPLRDPSDVEFVSKEMEVFIEDVKNAEKEKQDKNTLIGRV